MGGIYCTPNFDGSRTAGLVASSYAILISMGRNFYAENAKKIYEAVIKTKNFIKDKCELLEVIGDPAINGVSFTGKKVEFIYDILSKKGYHLNYLNNPTGIGFIFTSANVSFVDNFLKDLKEVHDDVLKGKCADKLGETAKLYGMAVQLPEVVAKNNLGCLADAILD